MTIELALTPDTRRADPAADLIAAASGAGFVALGLAEQDADASCAAVLAEAGAGLAVEFSPLGPVPSIAAALEVADAAGAGRAGVLIDSWHFFRGDSTWEQLACIPLERIAYVQFDDAPPPLGAAPCRRRCTAG